LEERVAKISDGLRKMGRRVGIEESLDAIRALRLVGISNPELSSAAIRSTLIKDFDSTSEVQQPETRFETIFKFQEEMKENRSERAKKGSPAGRGLDLEPEHHHSFELSMYSPFGLNSRQKILEISRAEQNRWVNGVNKFRNSILTLQGHRFRRSDAGSIDLRRTLRLELKRAGESPLIFRSVKKISKANLVLLCDVSGSMRSNDSKIVHLCFSVKRAIPKSEIFIFSTSLKRITRYASALNPPELAIKITKLDLGFGGGTRIGECLRQFRHAYGYLLTSRTNVAIFSDGWDVGDISLLRREMREIKNLANGIIWINPLLNSRDYSIESLGMKTALLFIDRLISPDDLFRSGHTNAISVTSRSNA